jgi:Lrp/AsnC family transcriptional regulator
MPQDFPDLIDKKILAILQENCTMPVADIASRVGLSTTPCWRRIQKMEEAGIITRKVALVDAQKVIHNHIIAFVTVTTNKHNEEWLMRFAEVVRAMPEVIEFYRLSGPIDYLLKVIVPDIRAYDQFYKRLVAQIDLTDVSSSFAMEELKYTTALPL